MRFKAKQMNIFSFFYDKIYWAERKDKTTKTNSLEFYA